MKNTIKLTKKSDKDVYLQHLRLVLFGIAVVGTIGFGIQFIFSVLTFGR
jgi:protein transport protein SEC61 subunit gamma-like protein